MSLFAELKRRNVIRVGGAYLALGWIVTQITATIAPVLHMPEWVPQLVVWIGAVGFPFVLLFAWAYELTPEGLKRESEVDRAASVTHVTGRRLDVITIVLVLVAIVLYAVDPLGAARRAESAESAAVAQAAPGAAIAPAASPVPASVAAAPAPDARSIAVLPFVDMSAGKDQEYMSDGIAEELLNLLAKIPELRVTSRSSAFAFKGERADIAEVARKLNVAHVLEGSVRTSGNRVRITAQLIDARSDQHLWSETYDRTLDDIFAVQDEIAAAVVAQLKIKLLGSAPKARVTDPALYAKFLKARELGRVFTPESFDRSNAMLKEVLDKDPRYAEAWERLGTNYINMGGTDQLSYRESYGMSRDAYRRALEIDPGYPAALDGIAWIEMFFDGDLAASARHYTQVLALAPGNVDVISNAARLLVCLGRDEQANAAQEYTALHDPSNPLSYENLAGVQYRLGRLDEAIANYRTLLDIASAQRISTHARLGLALLAKGDGAAALAEMERESVPVQRLHGQALAWLALGRTAEADAAIATLGSEDTDNRAWELATLHARRGDHDAAFKWLDRVVATQAPQLCGIGSDPLLAPLHDDPRWMPFLQEIGRAPEQLASIPFEVKLPQ